MAAGASGRRKGVPPAREGSDDANFKPTRSALGVTRNCRRKACVKYGPLEKPVASAIRPTLIEVVTINCRAISSRTRRISSAGVRPSARRKRSSSARRDIDEARTKSRT